MAEARSQARRRRRFRGPAALAGLLIAGLGAEVALACLAPQPVYRSMIAHTPACYAASERTPYQLLPGAQTEFRHPEFQCQVSINANGFRMDADVPAEAPAGATRVAIVGDSFTFGWGVRADQAWSAELARQAALADLLVDPINLGFAVGFSPDCYYAGLRDDPRVDDVDVLVVGVYVANDLTVVGLGTEWVEVDDAGLPLRVQSPTTRVDESHRWRLRSTLLRYQLPVWRESHLLVGLSRLLGKQRDPIEGREAAALRQIFSWQLYRDPWPSWIEDSFGKIVDCLVALRDVAERRGQRYLVALIPTTEQVYEVRMLDQPDGSVLQTRSFRQAPGDEPPQRRLIAALEGAGVAHLDLLPGLIAAQHPRLYFNHDNHWTAAGHEVAAGLLLADLRRRGWIEAQPTNPR